jgi:hypothetical protein
MSSNTEIDYGFYNFSAGENLDKVNAIALCRGDISPEECRSCVNTTSHDLLHKWCPNQKEAVVWNEGTCMIRYSNRDIFGVMESQPSFTVYAVQNASDLERFNQTLTPLLDGLRNRAASGNSTRKFAVGSATAPYYQTIYALVECTPDLDELECNDCLLATVGLIRVGMVGGRYGTPSCDLRYEIYEFYDLTLEATPPPSPPLPQASPPPIILPPPPTEGTYGTDTTNFLKLIRIIALEIFNFLNLTIFIMT